MTRRADALQAELARIKRQGGWPQKPLAEQLGCKCQWYGTGSIVQFDDACPILAAHKRNNQ